MADRVGEASSEDTPFGRRITSDGWYVLNLGDAFAVSNDEKGAAIFPLGSPRGVQPQMGSTCVSSRRASRRRITTRRISRRAFSF